MVERVFPSCLLRALALLIAIPGILSCPQGEVRGRQPHNHLPNGSEANLGTDHDTRSTHHDLCLAAVDSDPVYTYVGCWSETTQYPGGHRALAGGAHMVLPGILTVPICLHFCSTARSDTSPSSPPPPTGYQYAGLESSRECWCADDLSPRSASLVSSTCDAPCEGAGKTACGGSLALSLYNATRRLDDAATGHGNRNGAAATAAAATTAAVSLDVTVGVVVVLVVATGISIFGIA
ncbi:hypothetical protein AAE478_000135 [Parahypoxylon ruwenzoriense]